ncbi:pseudouridine synthase family protein [Actinidia rufa]|uniref:tRNA pseudouridine(55) synthase n=1 Tax=Actinidia rufa TaxID=165716 RepID=A0A7J0H7I0_9ERIC|nr:pseudouridine synthase family protein [Actinidia rufa]
MKPINLSRISLIFLVRPNPVSPSATTLSLLLHSKPKLPTKLFYLKPPSRPFSTTSTPYPLQYDMIISRPSHSSSPSQPRRRPKQLPQSNPTDLPESGPDSELGFDDWVDRKLTYPSSETENLRPNLSDSEMDKSKRKYYSKRRKRMYGSDSDDDGNRRDDDGFVELKPEVVEFRTLHKREEELYFHDTFAYPWEKDKHYKMVYQLEKKVFSRSMDEKGLVFFEDEEEGKDEREKGSVKDVKIDVSEKKVEEFFKCLKKVPNKDSEVASAEPFVSARSSGLPPKWDSPTGTVVLVNKPKGWTSFTVCGKLRRLIKVKKVGHAGTLDPMANWFTNRVESGEVCLASGSRERGEHGGKNGFPSDGSVIQREPWEHIKDDDIKKTAASFCGDIWQVPPMFSAIKVGGEKMYEKARRGESIELSPRRISIFQFDIERSLDDRQNLIFRVICSKGTYIRSLCADFGKSLSSCAHLTALRRDSIGQYSADDAWDFKELEEAITKDYL